MSERPEHQQGPLFRNGFAFATLTRDHQVANGRLRDGTRFEKGRWLPAAPGLVPASSLAASEDPGFVDGWLSVGQSNGAGSGGIRIMAPFDRPVEGAWMLGLAGHVRSTRAGSLEIVRAPDVRGGVNRSNIHSIEPQLAEDFDHLVPARARQYGRGKQGLSPDIAGARHYIQRMWETARVRRAVLLTNACVGGALWQSLVDPERAHFPPGQAYIPPTSAHWPKGRGLVDDVIEMVTRARDLTRAAGSGVYRVRLIHADHHEANDNDPYWARGFSDYLDDLKCRIMAITGQAEPPFVVNKQGASFHEGHHQAAIACLALAEAGHLTINAPDLSYADLWSEDLLHRSAPAHVACGAFTAEALIALANRRTHPLPRPLPDHREPVRRQGRELAVPLLDGPCVELHSGPFRAPDLSIFGGLKSIRVRSVHGGWLPLESVDLADGGTLLRVVLRQDPGHPVELHHATYGQSYPRTPERIITTPFAGPSLGEDCLGRDLRAALVVFVRKSDR